MPKRLLFIHISIAVYVLMKSEFVTYIAQGSCFPVTMLVIGQHIISLYQEGKRSVQVRLIKTKQHKMVEQPQDK